MKYLKAISTALLLVLLGSCSALQSTDPHKDHPYSGDHNVAQLRGMHTICFRSMRSAAPYFPPPIHITFCDCIVDKSRKKFRSQEYDGLAEGVMETFFRGASAECNQKLGIPPIQPKPAEPVTPDPVML